MSRASTIFSLILIVICSACGEKEIFLPGETTDSYEQSLEQWEKNNYRDYRYEFRWRCFCTRLTDWVEITVRNDSVVGVKNLESGEVYDGNGSVLSSEFKTIRALFSMLYEAYQQPADGVEVEYDLSKGFPIQATIDWNANTIDEEMGFEIRKVVVE